MIPWLLRATRKLVIATTKLATAMPDLTIAIRSLRPALPKRRTVVPLRRTAALSHGAWAGTARRALARTPSPSMVIRDAPMRARIGSIGSLSIAS